MREPNRDQVVVLESVPQPDAGVPAPSIVANERGLLLAYRVAVADQDRYAAVLDARDSAQGLIAIARFQYPRIHRSGSPNDEALAGHPLWARGLRHYAVQEVLESPWIRDLERMNRIHPRHDPASFDSLRHFVITFHDSTFECIAKDISVTVSADSLPDVVLEMSRVL